MALFESLSRMPGVTLIRDFDADDRLPPSRGNAYFHLAATREEWFETPEEVVHEILGYVSGGGRLVIAFLPQTSRSFARVPSAVRPGGTPAKNQTPRGKRSSDSPLFKDRWGVEFGFKSLPSGLGETYDPVQVMKQTDLPLPDSVDWHSGMIFTNVAQTWTTVYSRGTNPVVIERNFGSGSVVLMTDSFCLSNEAMVRDRHAELLSWLIGKANTIEFDEAHLGLVETQGVVSLMRKYRLHGFVAGLFLLVGLFIWRHAASFLPRVAPGSRQSEVEGQQAAAGFINLLRRNIAPRNVLRVCFDEWTKSFARRGVHSIARVDQAHAILEKEASCAKTDQDPVRAYREIRLVLKGFRSGHDAGPPRE
jgi:hypothetical protein